ncbi:unnamed protein product, partial [Effrenium voratum]
PAPSRGGDCRSQTGAAGQRHGGKDKSCLAKSAEDNPREVDAFREERRVEAKTARVRGR